MTSPLDLADLRRYAIARSLLPPAGLASAIDRLGFVQADPIRAPARAQDLVLRQRVVDYRVGDLDRAYPSLDVEEDAFVNYGFVARRTRDAQPSTVVHSNAATHLLDAVATPAFASMRCPLRALTRSPHRGRGSMRSSTRSSPSMRG